jgi:hypothetical protein
MDSNGLSYALALAEPNADRRGGLSWLLFALACEAAGVLLSW